MDNQNNPTGGDQGTMPTPNPTPVMPQKCVTCGNSASGGNCMACGQSEVSCTCTPQTGGEGTPSAGEQPGGEPAPAV